MRFIKSLVTQLNNQYQFYLSDSFLFVKEQSCIHSYSDKLEICQRISFTKDVNFVKEIDGYLFILDDKNNPYVYLQKNEKYERRVIPIDCNEKVSFISSIDRIDKMIIKRETEKPLEYEVGLFFLKTNEKRFFCNLFRPNLIIQDSLLGRSNFMISLFDENNGAILWQFSLSTLPSYKDIWGKEKPAEVIQILGIYENVLWVHIANFRLIGIDVKKGELLHNFENVLIGDSGNNFLDEQLGVIKILGNTYYAEFSLSNLSLIRKEKIRCNSEVKVRTAHFIKGDKNLYFCGYHNRSLHPNAFGIFDTEKAEIVWYETTKDAFGYFYNPPQASEKLLAILDDKQNLLIYERD